MLKRQGDLLFERLADSLVDLGDGPSRAIESGIVARGETTGHAHRVESGELVSTRRGTLVIAGEDTSIIHEEHDRVELESGVWLVHRQQEYLAGGETETVYD